jgi:hypothetical protein
MRGFFLATIKPTTSHNGTAAHAAKLNHSRHRDSQRSSQVKASTVAAKKATQLSTAESSATTTAQKGIPLRSWWLSTAIGLLSFFIPAGASAARPAFRPPLASCRWTDCADVLRESGPGATPRGHAVGRDRRLAPLTSYETLFPGGWTPTRPAVVYGLPAALPPVARVRSRL